MAYARTAPPPLTPELLQAALDGMAVRRLAAQYGLTRADAQGLARWAGPLLDALSEAPSAEPAVAKEGHPAPATAEIVPRHSPADAGAWPSAPPRKESRSAAPADDEEKTSAIVPTPVDAFEDVPAEFRTPQLAKVYRDTLAQAMGGAR